MSNTTNTNSTDCLHTLRVACPDCGQEMRLLAYNAVRHEKYDRKCRSCGSVWEITRDSLGTTALGSVDLLEWEQVKRGTKAVAR